MHRYSRYQFPVHYKTSDGSYVGMRTPIDASPRPDDRYHKTYPGDRLDILAFNYLGKAELWWVIADFNDIFFPLELEPGRLLRIPTIERLEMEIFK